MCVVPDSVVLRHMPEVVDDDAVNEMSVSEGEAAEVGLDVCMVESGWILDPMPFHFDGMDRRIVNSAVSPEVPITTEGPLPSGVRLNVVHRSEVEADSSKDLKPCCMSVAYRIPITRLDRQLKVQGRFDGGRVAGVHNSM